MEAKVIDDSGVPMTHPRSDAKWTIADNAS